MTHILAKLAPVPNSDSIYRFDWKIDRLLNPNPAKPEPKSL
jgi:hypothetical protein